jgi:hypothetical protein
MSFSLVSFVRHHAGYHTVLCVVSRIAFVSCVISRPVHPVRPVCCALTLCLCADTPVLRAILLLISLQLSLLVNVSAEISWCDCVCVPVWRHEDDLSRMEADKLEQCLNMVLNWFIHTLRNRPDSVPRKNRSRTACNRVPHGGYVTHTLLIM